MANNKDGEAPIRIVNTIGDPPSARMNHATVVLGPLMIVWGGEEPRKQAVDNGRLILPEIVDADLHVLNLGQ